MKMTLTLLIAVLLVVTASAVSAADGQSAAVPTSTSTPQAVVIGSSVLASMTGGCGSDGAPLIAADASEAGSIGEAAAYCGSCSTGGCAGAPFNSSCVSNGRLGTCTYYSGPLMCSTGGISCRCVTGPIP